MREACLRFFTRRKKSPYEVLSPSLPTEEKTLIHKSCPRMAKRQGQLQKMNERVGFLIILGAGAAGCFCLRRGPLQAKGRTLRFCGFGRWISLLRARRRRVKAGF